MYVCMYICSYVCMHACRYICMYVHACICIYAWNTCIHMYIHAYTYIHTYIRTYIHMHVCTYVHTYVCITYIHMYVCMYVHVCMYVFHVRTACMCIRMHVICSYNMCRSNLTDMYAWAWGLQAQGRVHTYQSNQEYTYYNCFVALSLPIVTTLVGWIPQVTITLTRKIISTNC